MINKGLLHQLQQALFLCFASIFTFSARQVTGGQ